MELRSLLPDETDAWLDHLDSVFVSTPRSYFERHTSLDPPLPGSIKVACPAGSNDIASTLRIYHRKIYINGGVVNIGGLGEVSTKEASRGQGLAASLIKLALTYMMEHDLSVSLLSTSKAAPLYARHGWRNVTRYIFKQEICAVPDLAGGYISALDFNDQPMLQQVADIHHPYCRRFSGPIVRDIHYWSSWVAAEATLPGHSNLVLYGGGPGGGGG
eukprot:TRINITY_DN2621_c1_g1_i3.p1 TRINITY_DN2621_c1_g1~~TRINITY_DN2621_c1_g1_i3.p1  ORF type:complete len:216 (+),score=32.35 TRINITY_DN2621_c1_g1_i3:30-677(+)